MKILLKETIKSDLNGDGKEDCLYIELGNENNYANKCNY